MDDALMSPANCPIGEQNADGEYVGRCWHHLPDGKTCPRHGDVTWEVLHYKHTGKITPENTWRKRIGKPLVGGTGRLTFGAEPDRSRACARCERTAYSHLDLCVHCALIELLVTEQCVTEAHAQSIVKKNTGVIKQGLMTGNLRVCVQMLMQREGL